MDYKRLKRVAIFGDFLSSLGGTEMYNTQLSLLFKKSHIDIRFFVGEKPKRDEWKKILSKNKIPVIINPFPQIKTKNRLAERLFVRLIRIYFIFWKPDIIFTHPIGKMILTYLDQTKNHFPIIATEWTTPNNMSSSWYQPDLKEKINKISTIIATCQSSEYGLRTFLNYTGNIKIIPHLIIMPKNIIPFDIKKRFSIGCISRLSTEKGLDYLIAAMSFVVKKYKSCTLHIYGHGPEKKHIQELINFFGLQKNCFFAGTYIPFQGIDDVAKKHCIFIQPSLFESVPSTIIELMARKRVILATNVGGVSELLKQYNYNVLSSAGDSADMAKKIISIIEDDNKLYTLSEQSFNIYNLKYNFEQIYQKIYSLFNDALKKNISSNAKD